MALMTDLGTGLMAKLRDRMAAGSPIWEIGTGDLPEQLVAALGNEEPAAVFASRHGLVAVLADGRRYCCKVPA